MNKPVDPPQRKDLWKQKQYQSQEENSHVNTIELNAQTTMYELPLLSNKIEHQLIIEKKKLSNQ